MILMTSDLDFVT